MVGEVELSEVWSVSDLHLCGPCASPMFKQAELLAALIRQVGERAAVEPTGLVLNGDTFDFLSHAQPGSYLDVHGAACTLEQMLTSPALRPVVTALSDFLGQPHALLVVAIGNHDVELTLPDVQARLVAHLCGGDAAARGRLVLALDGTGFGCRVGGRRVLFLHGNEVDLWNLVDHEGLRRLSRSLMRGAAPEVPPANAGTRLVVDVMNAVKARHRFVDLLKPEVEAVVPVLLALGVSPRDAGWATVQVALRLAADKARRTAGLLADAPDDLFAGDPDLAAALAAPRRASGPQDGPLLVRAEDAYSTDTDPRSLVDGDGTLAWGSVVLRGLFGGCPGPEALRRALAERGTAEDLLDPLVSDDTFERLASLVGPRVDVLVAGHTHVARCLPRGRGIYFNSGTWADLMLLTWRQVETPEAFAPVYEALNSGDLSGLVKARPTAVRVWRSGDEVLGSLMLVERGEDGRVEALPMPDCVWSAKTGGGPR